jgi:hypothetical protein
VSPSRSLVRDRNWSRSKIGTGGARLDAGRMPGQAQTRRKATRTVCPRSRYRPNPPDQATGPAYQRRKRPCRGHDRCPGDRFLLQSKVGLHEQPDQHICRMAAPFRSSRRQPAVFGGSDGARSLLRFGAAARGADGAGLAEVRVPKWFFVKGVELLPPHSYEAPFAHAHAVRSQTGPTLRSATVYTEPDCVTLLPRRVKVMVVGTTT